MENQKFDQFARESVDAPTRRTMLRGLAAVLGVSGLALAFGDGTEAGRKQNKKDQKREADKRKDQRKKEEKKREEKREEKKAECDAGGKVCVASTNPCQIVACAKQKCVTSNVGNGTVCGNGLECSSGQCVCPGGTCIVKVTPSDMLGWKFYNDQIDQPDPTTIEVGPATPPYGVGSAHLQLANTSEGKLVSAHIFNGTPLSQFDVLEYSVFVTGPGSGVAPSLQLGIDFDPDSGPTGWQGRLVFVPSATGPIPASEWRTFNVLNDSFGDGSGNWFFTQQGANGSNGVCPKSNYCTWSQVLAAFPKIRIHPQGPDEKAGAGWGFIGVKVGSGEGAVNANVDGIRIKIKGEDATTVYNFEPNS